MNSLDFLHARCCDVRPIISPDASPREVLQNIFASEWCAHTFAQVIRQHERTEAQIDASGTWEGEGGSLAPEL